MSMSDRQLILVDPDPELVIQFNDYFTELPHISIENGFFGDLPAFDCIVCPTSSFGILDRGVGAAALRYFGNGLQEQIRQYIVDEYLGEQPVGTAFIQETGDPAHPFLAHSPVIRKPTDAVVSDNIYHSMWGALLAIRKHNGRNPTRPINLIACPGLGLESPNVPHRDVAKEMSMAYRNFIDPLRYLDMGVKNAGASRIWMGKSLNKVTGELDQNQVENKDAK